MANEIVGIVTRQEKNSGLTLRARVTGPKQKVSKYQDFECMIKKAGLTDEQAVLAALRTIIANLNAKGINNLSENIGNEMPSVGEYDTKVTYEVTGSGMNQYLTNTGKIIKRPKYGEQLMVGGLLITVEKNSAVAQQEINVGIAPYTSEEIAIYVKEQITWDMIRGENEAEDTAINKNGKYNICRNLTLSPTLTCEMTADPIQLEWVVEDEYAEKTLGEPRVTSAGALTRGTYTSANNIYNGAEYASIKSLFDRIGKNEVKVVDKAVESGYTMRIGGLTIKVNPSLLNDNSMMFESITFDGLKTLSETLTNVDVCNYCRLNFSTLSSMFAIQDLTQGILIEGNMDQVSINGCTSSTIKYDTRQNNPNASELQIYKNADIIKQLTANNNLINEGLQLEFTFIGNDSYIKFYDISSITAEDANKKIETLVSAGGGSDTYYKSATVFNANGFVESGDYATIKFTKYPNMTTILAVARYTVSAYGDGSQPVFYVAYKMDMASAI